VVSSPEFPHHGVLRGTLSAVTHAKGIVLRFITVGPDGKENSLPVNQAEAELISVSEQGEFEIPKRSNYRPHAKLYAPASPWPWPANLDIL
jgi:hypothetical protein